MWSKNKIESTNIGYQWKSYYILTIMGSYGYMYVEYQSYVGSIISGQQERFNFVRRSESKNSQNH